MAEVAPDKPPAQTAATAPASVVFQAGDDDLQAEAVFTAVTADLQAIPPPIPTATCRLQLGAALTLRDATELVDYLHDLGIGAVYCSPFLRSRPGSTHGYDVVDHQALHAEIGTREDLAAFSVRLREAGMGLVVDVVPNHMGIGAGNVWWQDVLENGQASLYAHYFDIDWAPLLPELQGKVLLPLLADHYGRVLEDGQIRLHFDAGQFELRYCDHVLPVNPLAWPLVLETLVTPLIAQLGETDDGVLELQSVITGLRNLPLNTEARRSKALERQRETSILRRRLATLVAERPEIAGALSLAIERVNGVAGEPHTFDELDRLLDRQAYRLCYWRVAAEEINYRRFFDTNDLAAIRVELPEVFDHAHRLLLTWVRKGIVTGLRIDHPDGLWDPQRYFEQLQREVFLQRCRQRLAGDGDPEDPEHMRAFGRLAPRLQQRQAQAAEDPRSPLARPIWLVAEKILTRGETLPEEWPIHGTVGYEFAAGLAQLLVDPAGGRNMTEIYESFVGKRREFDELVYASKKLILHTTMSSELNVLAHRLSRLSARDRHSRDFTLGALEGAVREIIACSPVYRTYLTERTTALSEHDRGAVARTVRLAIQRNPGTEPSVWLFLRAILALDTPASVPPEDRPTWREWVMRLQQLTGPVLAKGVEDTAFYVYNRLVALNEVGGEPEQFGADLAAFHRQNAQRQRLWPTGLLTTSTHDTKRSEDVRARILTLSEMPEVWGQTLTAVAGLAQRFKVEVDGRLAPDANEEVLIYQTVLGTWPLGLATTASEPLQHYTDRIVAYMHKACREAKVNTSWLDPRVDWPKAVESFVRTLLAPESPALAQLVPLAATVTWHGFWSSLAHVVLRCMAPGIPDLYQGAEIWDFTMVDPDNRRPVDWPLRRGLLATVRDREPGELCTELLANPADGRLKLYALRTCLHLRRRLADVFGAESNYTPLQAEGLRADHVVAFSRRAGDRELATVVPRWTCKRTNGQQILPIGEVWAQTLLPLAEGPWRDVFTGRILQAREVDGRSMVPLQEVWSVLPFAVLERLT